MIYNYSHSHPSTYSSQVVYFQKRLNIIRTKFGGKWKHLKPDGLYGRNMRDAVSQFQEFAKQFQGFDNVVVCGVLDDVTQSAVHKFYKHALHNTLPPRRTAPPPFTSKYPQSRYLPSQPLYSGPPPRRSHNQPVVDTSSIIDTELKSLGKDIIDVTAEVAKYMKDYNLDLSKNYEKVKNALKAELLKRESLIANFIKRKESTFNAFHRREGMIGTVVSETEEILEDGSKYSTKTFLRNFAKDAQYDSFLDCVKKNPGNMAKARQMFVDMALAATKEAKMKAEAEAAAKAAEAATENAARWGKWASRAAKASWATNIGTSLWYVGHMIAADTEAEFNEYAGKLKDSLGTTAVDVGLALGGNVATRIAAGAIGGPAGIVVATLFTIADVVSLCATGESISTKIWNFIKSIDWDGVMEFIRPCFAGMDQYPT